MYRSVEFRTHVTCSPEFGESRVALHGSSVVAAWSDTRENATTSTHREGVLMGAMDWMDDENGSDESDADEMDGLDEFDDDLSGFDEPDEFGNEMDGFGGGDAADEFDDEMDGFGGGDAAAANAAELEDRIGELENQVSSISSDMNTVRQENIQIGDTVDELDDTIRKLLDIYEMVTRGINPFVDDAREMGGLDGGDGAFGLFDAEEEDEGERLDDNVAGADAESFFDDDLGALDAEEGEQRAEIAAGDELEEEERDPVPDADATDDAEEPADGGGASFDDLKAEYDAEGGWSEEDDAADAVPEEPDPEGDATDLAAEEDDVDDRNEVAADAEAEEESTDVDADEEAEATFEAVDAETDDPTAPDEGSAGATRGVTVTESDSTAATAGDGGDGGVDGDDTGESAYLSTVPHTYVAETTMLKWADYLVSNAGTRGAIRAVGQYRKIGWLSASAAAEFEEYVLGAADGAPGRSGGLTVDDHTTSLAYLARLAGDGPEAITMEVETVRGGENGGIRR